MFSDFDFDILEDPDFKEDSVREELILPIIKKLGYSVQGENKIIRSKSLVHPYVAIGSKKRKVSIVPDYLFSTHGKCYWVLDAKSPTEDILKTKHVEQAYSYAIHPEVRAKYYALCNGREFILYSINKFEPILHFQLSIIDEYWNVLNRILNPSILANDEIMDYQPDFGLHMLKMGAAENFKFMGLAINTKFISKVEDGLYTLTTATADEREREFALSIDFNEEQLHQLLALQPKPLANYVSSCLKRQPYYALLQDEELKCGVVAVISKEIQENAEEEYLPFIVDEFMEYNNVFESQP